MYHKIVSKFSNWETGAEGEAEMVKTISPNLIILCVLTPKYLENTILTTIIS